MWRHIVIEGICLAQEESHPCGRDVSPFCLYSGHCPHLGYTSSDEREAACFVPLHLILLDRFKDIAGDAWRKLSWYIWHRWFFKKKWAAFEEYVRTHTVECPAWEKQLKQDKRRFPAWFAKATKEEVNAN